MTLSRWKVMAGVVGVSLGGLAIAAQCPRPDSGQVRRAHELTVAEAPKSLPTAPAPMPAQPSPAGEALPPLPVVPVVLPELPAPAEFRAPATPPKSDLLPAGANTLPPLPMTLADAPPDLPKPSRSTPPAPPVVAPSAPAPVLPTPPTTSFEPVKPAAPTVAAPTAAVETVRPAPMLTAPAADPLVVAAATKFRIILRVGEGEPTFEVRHDDSLVLKVLCEKVDIKSPEKGQGLSAVTATGKVRFVGFGAEGTCDSFSFLAGTGEVAMTGNVKVQVKDKIGRVESELTAETLKYRLDTNAMPGLLKP